MNFEELIENLTIQLKAYWERIQDSSFYHNLNDRYENLSPTMQKAAIVSVIALVALILLSIPMSNLSESSENISTFNAKRELIRDLFKSARDASDVPNIARAPTPENLKSIVENTLTSANILPEQIGTINIQSINTNLFPPNLSSGSVSVTVNQLNQQQIIDIGYRLQTITQTVKLKDLVIVANQKIPGYFNVVYTLFSLAVPEEAAPPPEPKGNFKGKNLPQDDEE